MKTVIGYGFPGLKAKAWFYNWPSPVAASVKDGSGEDSVMPAFHIVGFPFLSASGRFDCNAAAKTKP